MDTKRLVEKFYIVVLLDCAKGAFGLDGAVRAQQRSVDTVKIGKNFLVEAVSPSFKRMVRLPISLEHWPLFVTSTVPFSGDIFLLPCCLPMPGFSFLRIQGL